VVSAVGEGVDRNLLGTPVVVNPALDWGPDPAVQGSSFRILGLPDNGTYAEYVSVPAANVSAKPEGWSFEQAAAFPLATLTAYRAVVTRAAVRPSEMVLITGIGGGVATCALQIASSLGAKVIVTSASDEKLERARALGAAAGFNYRKSDWAADVVRYCGGVGPDVAVDSAGGDTFAKLLEIVKPGGRIVNFGATTGPADRIEVRRIFWKQLTILGSTMGTGEEFAAALKLFEQKRLVPVVDSVYDLRDAGEAHRRMEQGGQFGKIVLRI
jgi:NADPH:quinone reductase-like Zn-dependent oxidoreductase